MISRILKKKPLVEAILEVKWQLPVGVPLPSIDPGYRVFVGRFYDCVSKQYPAYEALPTAAIPDEMARHVAQYRFRSKQNGWPLLQIGPGILTLNDTDSYIWSDYEKRADWALERLFESFPGKIDIESLVLRYIDSVEVNFETEDVVSFLREKLKVQVEYPSSLFQDGHVDPVPSAFILQSAFKSKIPEGTVQVKFARGKVNEKDSFVWETVVVSSGKEIPSLPSEFSTWLGKAHTITDDWFFKLIDGELLTRFE